MDVLWKERAHKLESENYRIQPLFVCFLRRNMDFKNKYTCRNKTKQRTSRERGREKELILRYKKGLSYYRQRRI